MDIQTMTPLMFGFSEVVQFAIWAFGGGALWMSVNGLTKNTLRTEANTQKRHEDFAMLTDRRFADNVAASEKRFCEITERQEKLELRHIAAMEKLGDALAHFADEVRATVGDHTSRLNYIEKTIDN